LFINYNAKGTRQMKAFVPFCILFRAAAIRTEGHPYHFTTIGYNKIPSVHIAKK
jgi:hypothetical protein